MPNNNLANATKPMDTSDMNIVSFPAAPPAPPNASADPEFSPIALAPIPPVMGTDTDAARQFYRNAVSQLRMPPLPAAAKIAQGAQAASQVILSGGGAEGVDLQTNNVDNPVQNILNLTGSGVSYGPGPGQVQITTGGGDGLIHGQGNIDAGSWESDPAYVVMRDDFFNAGTALNSTAIPTTNIGQYNWLIAGTLASGGGMSGGAPSNAGFIGWGNTATQQQAGWLLLPTGNNGDTTTNHATNCMALLENPPWKMTWIFQVAPTTTDRTTTPLITKRAMYVGLTGPGYAAQLAGPVSRPNQFMGLRYDTSVTPGALTVTNVTAGSGVAVYTFTALTGTNAGAGNGFVGMRFTTAGFTHANNNVTSALCTASTTSTITLVNASGGTTTDSGTATGPIGPSDTNFVLEVVNNPIYSAVGRNNQQGTTLVTNVVPTIGVWHRLDIICTVAGKVTITLDGSSVNTLTATCPVTTISPGSGSAEGGVSAGIGFVAWTVGGTVPSGPWNAGSVVAISGFTGTQAGLNGTVTLWECNSGSEIHWYSSTGVGTGTGGSATLSGYPTWTPLVMFGNDDTASPTSTMNMNVDFFSFIWNPGVGGGTGTPSITKSRYF